MFLKSSLGSSQTQRTRSAIKLPNSEVEERFGIQLADSIIACVLTLREQRYEDPPETEETMETEDKMEEDDDGTDAYIEVMKSHQVQSHYSY